MEKIGIAIVGAGGIASAHAKAVQQIPDEAKLVAVADIDEDRAQAFAQRYQVPVWTTEIDDVLRRDDVHAVHLCVPHHLHAPFAISALQAGKHVLVEKPMAISLEEADQMLAAAKKANRQLGVVFQLRFEPDVRRASQVIRSGAIGTPFYAEVSCLWWRRPVYYEVSWRGKWATEGGGAVINQAVHHVDLLIHLLGMPSEVQAHIATIAHDIEVEDWCLATLRWQDGLYAVFCASTAAELESDVSRMLVLGQYGTIQMFPFRPYSRQEERLLRIAEVYRGIPEREMPGHTALVHDFIRAVRKRRAPQVSGVEGRHALELVTAIYQSALTGEPVRIPLSPQSPCYTNAGKLEMARRYVEQRAKRT